jgi:hypothetical protein
MDDLDRFLRSLEIGSGSDREETPEDQPIYAVAASVADDTGGTSRFISGAVRSFRRQGIPAWARFSEEGAVTGSAWLLVVRAEDLDRARVAWRAYMERVNRRARRNPAAD